MRIWLFLLALVATQGNAFDLDKVPKYLLNELAPPELAEDGCALSISETDKHFGADDGSLVECGRLLDGERDGYWVHMTRFGDLIHGWYRRGKLVGTSLVLTKNSNLVGVFRFDEAGNEHGVSFMLEKDGRLAWKQVHIYGRQVFTCEAWKWPC